MSAQDLIAKYKAKEATFTIELMSVDDKGVPTIDPLVVKQLRSAEEMTELKIKAMQFAGMLQTNPPKEFKAFLPLSEQIGEMALVVSELVIEPPVSQLDALAMAKDAGQLLAHIYGQIMGRNAMAAGIADAEAIEAAKKRLAAMSSDGDSSPSDATSSAASTPTGGITPTGDTPASTTPSPS